MTIQKIPITVGFDQEKIIGYAEIDIESLPDNPNYVLSLGYTIEEGSNTPPTIKMLGVVNDLEYLDYLVNSGVI